MAGDQDDRQIRVEPMQVRQPFGTAPAAQPHVGDDHERHVGADQRAGGFDRAERRHRKSGEFERLNGADAHVLIILDIDHADAVVTIHARALSTSASGRSTTNSAPSGSRFLARNSPPNERAMWLAITRPRPRPFPAGLVVTNGSNRRCRTLEAIAGPLLPMAMRHWVAGPSSRTARI